MSPWSESDYQALAPYEGHFLRMERSRWCPYPGRAAVALMHEIYQRRTGSTQPFSASCNNCVNKLVAQLGKAWLAEKRRRENQ